MKRTRRSPLDAYTLSVRGLLPPVGLQGVRSRGVADSEVRRVPASGDDPHPRTRPLRIRRVSRDGRTRRG